MKAFRGDFGPFSRIFGGVSKVKPEEYALEALLIAALNMDGSKEVFKCPIDPATRTLRINLTLKGAESLTQTVANVAQTPKIT